MRVGSIIVLLVAIAGLVYAGFRVAGTTPTETRAQRIAAQDHSAYSLPPVTLERAVALDGTRRMLTVTGTIWGVLQLLLILATGAAARIRDVAVRFRSRWVQAFVFLFWLLVAITVLNLPLGVYGHLTALRYGLSVQGWASWLADTGKVFLLEWLIGGALLMLLMWVMRRSPERWWIWFWIPAAGALVASVFLMPYVIDPLFNDFEPLAKADPALVRRLEQVATRGGLGIPSERMFLMRASAKSTEMNAYVTGFGASKRVVVWDTTIAKVNPDEIAFVFAHEMGHYELGHVVLGLMTGCLALLPFFWLGHQGLRLLLRQYGESWKIAGQHDWAAVVVLGFVLMTVAALSDPIDNAFSRRIEHDADVYGQEAVHGIVADPQQVGQQSFQVLGEESLDDPTPHPLFDAWFGTHPAVWFRAAFARAYDPWRPGEHPKYFAN